MKTLRRHPDGDLVAYLREELDGTDRDRVAAHVRACAECRDRLAAFDGVLLGLRRPIPDPPRVHWGHYRAQLRDRLADGRAEPASGWWWRRPLPLALSAMLAGMLLVVAVDGVRRQRAEGPVALEETVLGGQLELLQTYPVVERLDLLENLDVIRQLDRLAPSREG
jgi:anti-sigma factor RsiW